MALNKIDALKDLLAKVEAGTVGKWPEFTKVFPITPDDKFCNAAKAYHGSLDAAKALRS